MCGFLIDTTEPDKSAGQPVSTAESRLEEVWHREVPHVKRTLNMPFFVNDSWYKRVIAMNGVYSAFAGAKSCQLRISG